MVARIEKDRNIETPGFAWLVGLAAWAIPGAGHLMQKRWRRGALAGGAVWVMFLTGLWLGGHLYGVTGQEQGFSVFFQLLPMIANVGVGLLYIFCWIAGVGFTEHAQLVTYEYGNTFLLVAGLLNYLVMLDAFDIAAGEKAMRHVLWMVVFAALTAVVFGIAAKGTERQRLIYGVKVFGEFVVIAFLLGWILYFIPSP